ncbi:MULTISPECIES: phosphate uptake regulator PhoU [Acidianus]|uniref:Phosphate uptake regulator PhoU n=1 Tax=Candidatus Acidianus copahuensis TaxID=1160895 RepID=A0A031LNW1_9CREN|nr:MULTISPECIES: phosphate uptake regulator PhoU [Acidianus]EZQ04834.1 phosphate uptake regulator PhoU [Candidatus Acidianus copahuensis]NON62790.1 phosphate uptake regulator PhoU [Acidianus sp. RZ1]
MAGLTRRIQLTGGSTYIISLPKNWVKELSLKPGDEVEIIKDTNLRLIISPRENKEESKQSKAIIHCQSGNPEFAIREFISHYMAGYVTVTLTCPKMRAEDRATIKDVIRRRLLGAEVIEEDANNISVQFLVNEKDLPISKAISRAAAISKNMIKDVLEAIKTKDPEIASEVPERDDEVDRFFFYVSRQLTLSVSSFEILEEEGYNIAQIVDVHSAIKSIERISDHASRIAYLVKDVVNGDTSKILELGYKVLELYSEAVNSFIEGKKEIANKIIAEDVDVAKSHRSISSDIISKESENKIQSLLLVDSFRRISRYSVDIAETTINMIAKRGG